jgi:hypothetical protein
MRYNLGLSVVYGVIIIPTTRETITSVPTVDFTLLQIQLEKRVFNANAAPFIISTETDAWFSDFLGSHLVSESILSTTSE